jgi:RNA polymerase subunit RPABC4/transcription elongation factor Spt4
MSTCKNCEGALAVAGGYCQGCIEEQQEEMEWNGFTCRYCDTLVHDEGDACAECLEAIAEEYYDAKREEELIEKHFGVED